MYTRSSWNLIIDDESVDTKWWLFYICRDFCFAFFPPVRYRVKSFLYASKILLYRKSEIIMKITYDFYSFRKYAPFDNPHLISAFGVKARNMICIIV